MFASRTSMGGPATGVLSVSKQRKVSASSNLYQVLSLDPSRTAGIGEIKKAYRSMARRCHPDVCHDPSRKEESNRVFVELSKAYETLSDPVLRRRYDSEMGLGVRLDFERGAWEAQLCGLWRRSEWREKAKRRSSC